MLSSLTDKSRARLAVLVSIGFLDVVCRAEREKAHYMNRSVMEAQLMKALMVVVVDV